MKYISIILLFVILFSLTSCTAILSTLWGFKSNKPRNLESIEKYAKKYKIPSKDLCLLDTTYLSFINNIESSDWQLAKKHYQPLQALYFNNSGELISFHNNCHAGGFPNFKWNRNGILEKFVPDTQIKVDSLINFEKQLQFLRTINGEKLTSSNYATADYNVVVYWNVNMGRQSKRLIKYLKSNCRLAGNQSVNLLFANDDEFIECFGQ